MALQPPLAVGCDGRFYAEATNTDTTMRLDAWKMAVLGYGASLLPHVRAIAAGEHGRRRLIQIGNDASKISMSNPLHLMPGEEWSIPSFRLGPPLSSAEIAALMVVVLWVQCGECEEAAAPLLEDWPVREMVLLAEPVEA